MKIALMASKAGVTPPSAVIADTLLIREVEKGVSMDKVAADEEWKTFYLQNENDLLFQIGRTYGVLNKKLRIKHYLGVRVDHIFITADKKVYIIDFSTWAYSLLQREWILNSRITNEANDLDRLCDSIQRWLHYSFNLKSKNLDMRLEWVKKGYESVDKIEDVVPASSIDAAI